MNCEDKIGQQPINGGQELPFVGFEAGQIVTASRRELARDNGENLSEPEQRAFLKCFQRLAALPVIEGLALSQIKLGGGLYFTVVWRNMFSGGQQKTQIYEEVTDALHDLGQATDQILPGDFINLQGRARFERAVGIIKKEGCDDLELLAIMHFVK